MILDNYRYLVFLFRIHQKMLDLLVSAVYLYPTAPALGWPGISFGAYMANSDWIEADRVERLKPKYQAFYTYCYDLMQSKNGLPRYDGWGITRIVFDPSIPDCFVSILIASHLSPIGKVVRSFEDLYQALMDQYLRGHHVVVPPDLKPHVDQERRLRESEETIEYRLESGDPF